PTLEEERRAEHDFATWTRKHNLCPEFRFIRSLPKDDRAMMIEFYSGASPGEKRALLPFSLYPELELALVRHRQNHYDGDYVYEIGLGDVLVLDERNRANWTEWVKTFGEAVEGSRSDDGRYIRK